MKGILPKLILNLVTVRDEEETILHEHNSGNQNVLVCWHFLPLRTCFISLKSHMAKLYSLTNP